MAGTPHPSFERLTDLLEGRLSGEAAGSVQAHLATCVDCAEETAGLARLIAMMRTDRAEDAPPAVLARAVRLFAAPTQAAPPRLRDRLIAALRFDSGAQPLTLGLRAAPSAPRQLLYGSDDYDLDVQITLANDRWLLAGQLLGPDTGRQVVATGPGGEIMAALNEQGEFALSPLPPGRYTLRIVLDDTEILLPALDLGL